MDDVCVFLVMMSSSSNCNDIQKKIMFLITSTKQQRFFKLQTRALMTTVGMTFSDIEKDWKELTSSTLKVSEDHIAHKIRRDGHCHSPVMWFRPPFDSGPSSSSLADGWRRYFLVEHGSARSARGREITRLTTPSMGCNRSRLLAVAVTRVIK